MLGRFLLIISILLSSASAWALPANFAKTQIASGIDGPTTGAFTPDGRLFVLQQNGNVRVIKNGALLTTPFLSISMSGVGGIGGAGGERGLLGIAFDPAFSTNNFVYLYYTTATPNIHNRVSRFTANGDVAVAGSEQIIFELPPLSTATNHNAGALKFGPDGKLYVATGNNPNAPCGDAQSLNCLMGKILRINSDGTIPTDNPFYTQTTGNNRAIWVLGMRNPFTMAIQPGTGRIFAADVGESTTEEIDDITRGSNYGWPTCEGNCNNAQFKDPFISYGHGAGCCVIGGAFYNPTTVNFPASYVGMFFYSDLCEWSAGAWLKYVDPTTKAITTFEPAGTYSRPVSVLVKDDGDLYVIAKGPNETGTGVVFKIHYSGTGAPTITTPPASQTVAIGDNVTFSVTATGTAPLAYQWQRTGADITGATSSTLTLNNVQLSDSGATFACRVSNANGSATSASATLTVLNDHRPTATINSPLNNSLYTAGDTIAYAGTATDTEDGDLPSSGYTWTMVLHHDTHTHPFLGPINGVTGGTFQVPTDGEVSANVWYEIQLQVTDSSGLTCASCPSVIIVPRTSVMSFATSPSGLQITLEGQPMTTPLQVTSVVGINRTLGAPSPQFQGSNSDTFVSWSDSGAQTHNISTPATDSSYTATFSVATALPSLTPIADSYVRDGTNAGTNFGTATSLFVKQTTGSGFTRSSFLKFDLSSVSVSSVVTATLQVTVTAIDVPPGPIKVYSVTDDTWTETGITWNNQPARATLLATASANGTGVVNLDITSFINSQLAGDKKASLALVDDTNSNVLVTLNSREAASGRPTLAMTATGGGGGPSSLAPTADSYVRDGTNAGTNFGTATSLFAKQTTGSGFTRNSFLKFDLSGVSGSSVTNATLQVTVTAVDTPPGPIKVYSVTTDTWTETGITWNNQPARVTLLASASVSGAGVVNLNVTSFINSQLAGDRTASLALVDDSNANVLVTLNSREAASGQPALSLTP